MASNIFRKYNDSIGVSIDVTNEITDGTSAAGMTPQALRILQGAINGARAAGLERIAITAGRGGNHLSHRAGTEWDIKGYNLDGSLWSKEQRVAVAEGARRAGADRFGIYHMERGLGAGTLHYRQFRSGKRSDDVGSERSCPRRCVPRIFRSS